MSFNFTLSVLPKWGKLDFCLVASIKTWHGPHGGTKIRHWPAAGLSLLQRLPPSSKRKPIFCSSLPLQQPQQLASEGIMCESCNGRGWLLCDFCEGQKTNVKSESNRIYRRCPTCRAVGYTLCTKCKVFKCVTFPDSSSDGVDLSF